jgi:hypothetical protein
MDGVIRRFATDSLGSSVSGTLRAMRRLSAYVAPISADVKRIGAFTPLRHDVYAAQKTKHVFGPAAVQRFARHEVVLGGASQARSMDLEVAAEQPSRIVSPDEPLPWPTSTAADVAQDSVGERQTPTVSKPSVPMFEPNTSATEVLQRMQAYLEARDSTTAAQPASPAATPATAPPQPIRRKNDVVRPADMPGRPDVRKLRRFSRID